MSYSLELPARLVTEGWKIKIRNFERLEPPHVAIIRGTRLWRYEIRDPGFLDRVPPPREVPEEVIAVIHKSLDELRQEWNRRYPRNPV